MCAESEIKNILVVADEPDTRIFICNVLTNFGFEPIGADNMVEGLEIALAKAPSLIILDLMMAQKAGIQMYLHLKTDDILKHVPVIMLSAIDRDKFSLYNKFQSVQRGSGVPEPDAYLEKPPEADELARQVRTLTAMDSAGPAGRARGGGTPPEGNEHHG